MLVDRITKETTDISRDFLDMSWWLDAGETITHIVSQKVILGMSGWTEAPYPPPGGEIPYDPFPLEIDSAVIAAGGTQLEVFVSEGSPSLAYTCQFVLDGSSSRRVTIEMGVQVTGVAFAALGSGPLPSYLAVTISDTPPSEPQCGQLWFDSIDPQLYIYYCDPSSSQWVIVTSDKGGLATDAPYDGGIYSRQNGVWVLASGFGNFVPLTGGTITGGSLFLDYRLSQPGPNDQPAPNSGLLVRWTNTSTVGPLPPINTVSAPINVVASDWSGAVTSIWGLSVSLSVSSAMYGTPGVGPWPQHVGGSFTVAKTGGNPWVAGIHVTAREQNSQPSSSNSGLIGIEIAHQASGDDDGGLAFSPGSRLGIHMSSQAWPAPKWAASTVYAVGAIVNPPSGSAVVFTYICTVGGTSGSTQPTWPVSAGTVTDGSVTWSLNGYLCVHGMGYNLDGGFGTIIKSLFGVTGAITYQAFDARTATAPPNYTDPVAALRMSVGQIIDFNGASTLTHAGWIGPAGSYLQFVSASPNRLRWVSGGNEIMSINDLGTLTIAPLFPNPAIVISAEDCISFSVNQNRNLLVTAVGGPQRLAYQTTGGVDLFSVSDAGALQIGGTAGPTWTQGSGAPFTTQPIGSIYSRVGGAVGATLYVSRGGGTWAAVAGV